MSRRETAKDRGKLGNAIYKKYGLNNKKVKLTHRSRATVRDIAREVSNLSQATQEPVTFDEAFRVVKHLPKAFSNLLMSKGEIYFKGFGTLINILVKQDDKKPKRYHSSDENFNKLGYTMAFISTQFSASDNLKAALNNRPTVAEKIKNSKNKQKELRQKREQAYKEEDAALAIFQMYEKGDDIDTLLNEYTELIYWNDFSCFHTVKGTKINALPVRKEKVRQRLLDIIIDSEGGKRYCSVWDEFMSIAALKARGIEPNLSKWFPHDWSFNGYLEWGKRRGKGV